jgi:hypothetical protein
LLPQPTPPVTRCGESSGSEVGEAHLAGDKRTREMACVVDE